MQIHFFSVISACLSGRQVLSHQNSTLNGTSWAAIFFLCMAARLFTTINYIEDPDSLRFALSIENYNLASLQPHFPGYPVFCFVVKALTIALSKFSYAFSIVGGFSTFVVIFLL